MPFWAKFGDHVNKFDGRLEAAGILHINGMKVLTFSLFAAVLLASVIEQPESVSVTQQPVEKIDEVVNDEVPVLVQQAEHPVLPTVIQQVEQSLLPAVISDESTEDTIDVDSNETLDVLPNETIVQVINEIVNVNPEEVHSSASASGESDSQPDNAQEEEDQNGNEDATSNHNSESSEDDIEEVKLTSQLVQRKPASSPLVSSSSSSIEEIHADRPQVPQDIRIWPILLDIFQTPFIMEMMTWSAMMLFVAILFHHMFSNY